MIAPRMVTAATPEQMLSLLLSLNEAGFYPEVAGCTEHGATFIAGLWDVDYAGAVHYVLTEADSGMPHCHMCSGCGRYPTGECDYDAPGYPLHVVLTEDPPPATTLDEGMVAWWRA